MGVMTDKKGIFYLFIAMLFLMAIFIIFQIRTSYDYTDAQQVYDSRVKTMNDFISDLNNDVAKATYIAAYRALIAMEEEIAQSGNYYTDAEPVFQEAFFNGTINGNNKTILNSSSFSDYAARVGQTASYIGINLEMNVNGVELYHEDPWHVMVKVNFTTNLSDQHGIASWYYNMEKETSVPISSLRDPIYTVGTLGRAPNTIQRTNLTYFINDTNNANDTTNLLIHANKSLYTASSSAPSYVMRLEGNFSPSQYGLQSLVYIPGIEAQGLTIETSRSIVDYIYFDNNLTSPAIVCDNIINTPAWFKMDEDNIDDYEIDPKLNPEGGGYTC